MLRLLLAVAIVLLHGVDATAGKKPNVMVILADDLGWGDLGCYPKGAAWGDEAFVPTPNLDALAASGVRCMQGYATAMVCAPSRAGLLSGQHQQRWGFYGFEETLAPIPAGFKLLPQAMREAGYRTALIGKWHVSTAPGSLPLQRGFDRFFGFLGGQHDYFDPALGQTFHGVGWARDAPVFDQDRPVKKAKYLTEEFTDRAITFMVQAKQEDKPFFVYLPYSAPHPPHQAPWADLGPYVQRRADGKFVPRDGARAMIVNLDRNIGRLTAWLRDNAAEEDTLIFFSSDNGGSDGGPGRMLQHNGGLRGRKSTYYEGGVRVPFIVRWPAKLPAGLTYDRPVSQLDIYATALAASAEQVVTQPLDGVDLVPYLAGLKSDACDRRLCWSLEQPTRFAIRDGDWKLVLEDLEPETLGRGASSGGARVMKLQLFDLASDPFEASDLAAERPELVQKLQAICGEFRAQCAPSLYTPEIEQAYQSELAQRRNHPALRDDHRTAYGGPGHWFGGGARERAEREAQDAALTTQSAAARVHTIESEFQNGPGELHVLLPDTLEPDQRYPVLYVLPVYHGAKGAQRAIAQAHAEDLGNRFGLICITPSFEVMPWYADHATDLKHRQESHILQAVLPFVEKTYPTITEPRGRLLVGYSKSGWGAMSLLLRHPDVFGRAGVFDAPLMMGRGGRFRVPAQVGPEEHFAHYCVADLIEQRAGLLRRQPARFAIFGQGIFNEDQVRFHELLLDLGIPHVFENALIRRHAWDSGWLTPAVEAILPVAPLGR